MSQEYKDLILIGIKIIWKINLLLKKIELFTKIKILANNLVQHHISQSLKSKIYASLVLIQLHSLKTQTHNSFNPIS